MKRFALISLILLTPALAVAESSAPPESGKLHFGVVVTDERGAPIRDLSSNDFIVESGGKSHPVQVQSIAAPVSDVEPSPGEFSNRSNAVKGRGLVVIVMDTIHTPWVDERDIRPAIVKYLASCASRNLPVSLLVMDPHAVLHSVHDYTTSSATLTAALDRADALVHGRTPKPETSSEVVAESVRLSDFVKGANANLTATSVLRASPEPVLQMFRSIAEATAGIPGRKSLIWIANITPFEVEDKIPMIASPVVGADPGGTTDAFGRSLTAQRELLSADEVKQLRPLWKSSMSALQSNSVALVPILARRGAEQSFNTQILHAMKAVAAMTGGREVHSIGDPFASLSDLADQNLAAYDLAGAAASQACKSEWCDLKITVKRPGARVLAASGFFREPSGKQANDMLADALMSPLDFTGIPFSLRWSPAEAAGAKRKIGFVVTFPPEAHVIPEGGNEISLEISTRATTIAGENKQDSNFNAAGQLLPQAVEQVRQHGFALNNAIELPPGDYIIKFFVRDKPTGRLGSLSVPLKVS